MENQLKDKKILALIPARGGSKGIPKKNIIDLGGHPLIAYSIAAAKLSKYINRVIVTTDSEEIAEVSKKYGAETPFLRPKEYAQDHSPDRDFFEHALTWLEKNEKYVPDLIVHLRPVTPLRNHEIIDEAILEVMKDKNATSLRSAQLLDITPYKLFKLNGSYYDFFGESEYSGIGDYHNLPRQQFPQTHKPNGYVDIIIPEKYKETGLLHGKKIRAFVTKEVADIDNLMDLDFAKKLLEEKEYEPLIKFLNK